MNHAIRRVCVYLRGHAALIDTPWLHLHSKHLGAYVDMTSLTATTVCFPRTSTPPFKQITVEWDPVKLPGLIAFTESCTNDKKTRSLKFNVPWNYKLNYIERLDVDVSLMIELNSWIQVSWIQCIPMSVIGVRANYILFSASINVLTANLVDLKRHRGQWRASSGNISTDNTALCSGQMRKLGWKENTVGHSGSKHFSVVGDCFSQ